MYKTVQGFSSSLHPFPISHLLTGLHQSTFLTHVELFLLRGYQANHYTATSESKRSKQCTERLIFQLHREAAPKDCKPQFPTACVAQTLSSTILLVTHLLILNIPH